ncbi:MAG TPA: MFS transporter [Candidatus Dormibacteraeota bacterium]|nr:MFS transporter [Candidatus Dormibacteraeota bacterium]
MKIDKTSRLPAGRPGSPAAPPGEPGVALRATRVRWHIVALLAFMAGLTYVDRLNFGIAGTYIQGQFHLSNQAMGWILGSFSLGYAFFHIPAGWLGDRFGPRRILALAVLWWSLFTVVTAIVPHLPVALFIGLAWSFGIARFMLGVGESACLPVGNKTMGIWLGDRQRGFGTSVFLAGVGAGGILAPPCITWMAKNWGWQSSFYLCGVLGIVLAIAWYAYATDRPGEHRGVNAAELEIIQAHDPDETNQARFRKPAHPHTPWRRVFSSASVWGLMISHFCLVYPVYIFFTWFFIYLVRVRGISIVKSGLWGSTPFIATTFLVPFWGWLTDRAVEKFGKRAGRRNTVWLGVALSAILLWSGSRTVNNDLAILQLAAAAGFNLAAAAVLWITCNDITCQFSGSVSGVMTTFGSLGGWLSPVLTAWIATKFGWTQAIDFAALVTVVSGAAWFFIDPGRSLDDKRKVAG